MLPRESLARRNQPSFALTLIMNLRGKLHWSRLNFHLDKTRRRSPFLFFIFRFIVTLLITIFYFSILFSLFFALSFLTMVFYSLLQFLISIFS
jgi:hypothetical protein